MTNGTFMNRAVEKLKIQKYLAYKENKLKNILIMRLKLDTLKAYYYLPPYITYTY